MVSYRVSFAVGLMRPGVRPDALLPAAAAAARERTTVESYDVAVVRGTARINVRFLSEDNVAAMRTASEVHSSVRALAAIATPELARRYGPRWHPVAWVPAPREQ